MNSDQRDLLHGFLGLPADWEGVSGKPWTLWDKAHVTLEGLPRAFQVEIEGASPIAQGYGMGGRVLLQLVRALGPRAPWEKITLVSVHPGLESLDAREARLAADLEWARRFESDPWEQVLAAWNAQPVFLGTTTVARAEKDFQREALAGALRNWSLGRMDPWTPAMAGPKIEWVYGARDPWAKNHIQKLNAFGANVTVVPDVGHRVGWDACKNKFGQNSGPLANLKTSASKPPRTELQRLR